ncbi:hypothetical protein [Streptomyces sp. NPDC020607]|uniref:hypothetical protein n=1 Tax=Streptomyces sp. NPDC020607 TaxID=3365082 RepID=UPI0037AC036F
MPAVGRYTVGCVLEEQADAAPGLGPEEDLPPGVPVIDPDAAFEAGLALILDGLARRTTGASGG